MAKKECPSCAVDIDKNAEICPVCGYEFPRQKSAFKWVALLLIILFSLPFIRMIINFLFN